jgi:hypothetical protein
MCHFYERSLLQVSVFNVGFVLANPEQGYKQLILLVKERVWNYEKKV